MSASMKKYNKKSSSSTIAANGTSRTSAIITQQRYRKISLSSSSPLPSPSSAAALLTLNGDGGSSSSSVNEVELTIKANLTTTTTAVRSQAAVTKSSLRLAKSSASATFPTFKIMTYPNIIALLTVLVCGLVTVNGLKCYMCGQYNEGVGSITPCLNYSDQYAHLYLKECSKKSEKFCVKYVSELSIVRDCATECAEKEIWETQTYCCPEDGCNGSSTIGASGVAIMLPLIVYVIKEVLYVVQQQR